MTQQAPIDRAVEIVGSQALLGEKIGVSQGRISQFVGGELIDVEYFPRIEAATSGKVTSGQLLEHELEKLKARKKRRA